VLGGKLGRQRRRLSCIILAGLLGMSTAAFASDAQRMVLAPAACRVLAPGAYDDVDAYCLDQSRARPADGAILSTVPADVDDASVKITGMPPLTLSQALAQRIVEIAGRGSNRVVGLRNLTDRTVEICVDGPTVVMGADGDTRDVERIRDQIARLLHAREGAQGDSHEAIQQRLWAAVNASDDAESKKSTRDLVPAVVFPPLQKPASAAPLRKKCAGRADNVDVEICTE
jgi:hypothetical protein